MSRADNAIAGKHLGQKSDYSEVYNPDLLVAVPRQPNRDNIGVQPGNTPWKHAYDVWVAYEISSLLSNGQPFSGVGKIVYNGNSECIVESKSLKLYFNSLNQTRCKSSTVPEAYRELKATIEKDLSALLKTDVRIAIESSNFQWYPQRQLKDYLDTANGSFVTFEPIDGIYGENRLQEFTEYHENKDLLGVPKKLPQDYVERPIFQYHSSNLFSRCQITNQPDHGDVFIALRGERYVGQLELARYISSLRGHSCFHEPTVETIFKHIYDLVKPDELAVTALYTRRGGISIAPVRATHDYLLPYNLINHQIPHIKLPRE